MSFAIGPRQISGGAPVFVIAEAGVNHDGRLEDALALVDAAAESGADAVKFQTFDPSALASSDAPLAGYQMSRTAAESQVGMLEGLRLPDDAFDRVAERCAHRRVAFLSTPFDEGSADLLERLGVPAFKVGSGELTNLPFLRNLAARRRPLLLSTGMADLDEVGAAMDAVAQAGATEVALLHCVSSYPAPPDEANLRAMDTLREAFHVPVGFSDHSLGPDVSLAAVARGAELLERHLTLDRKRPGPDHAISLEPQELSDLVRRVRVVESALGDGRKRSQPSELETRAVARRSLVALRDLAAGDTLTVDAVGVKRPGGGLPPAALDDVVGARLRRPVRRDQQLTEADLEPRPASSRA
jgi:N-acetylneuraminate synthase/N,N'-diacetyllegionaminate synthase